MKVRIGRYQRKPTPLESPEYARALIDAWRHHNGFKDAPMTVVAKALGLHYVTLIRILGRSYVEPPISVTRSFLHCLEQEIPETALARIQEIALAERVKEDPYWMRVADERAEHSLKAFESLLEHQK